MDQDRLNNNENKSSFWRTNNRALPGRPSRGTTSSCHSAGEAGMAHKQVGSSFQTFQDSVSDAWDVGDDEFCIISGLSDTKISRRVSQSAALNVIKTHRSSLSNNPTQTATGTNNNNHSSRPTSKASTGDESSKSTDAGPGNNNHLQEGCSTANEDTTTESPSDVKRKPRLSMHSYPGRPQLLKLSSNLSKDDAENQSKTEKFETLLNEPLLNLMELKKLSWSGVPKRMRPVTWRLLSGYLPTALERRNAVLERKRSDYLKLVDQYFVESHRDEGQEETFRQIHIDVPRMNPHVQLFQQAIVQQMFERILFIWAIRHPASGYVQGINDLVTPFFIIFLQEALQTETRVELETFSVDSLAKETRDIIEADSFWCLSKFLDCLQDNYIFAQLGIQAKVNQLKELIQRIDLQLHKHLVQHGVDYLQFSFRWMNNLLTRELPLHCTIRLWDTYLAESDGFAQFQLYVCAAFLLHWRAQLMQERDFQGLMIMVQNLPTTHWTDAEIKLLVAEAYRLKFTYADAPKHFEGKS